MTIQDQIRKSRATQADIAKAAGISPAALSLIVRHDKWPVKKRKEIEAAIKTALQKAGVAGEADRESPKKTGTDTTLDTKTKEDTEMLMRKQTLLPRTKKAFCIVRDIFGDLSGPEDVYLTPDMRYVRETMYQTAKHGGMLAVIGESGSGKTTLRKDLHERITQSEEHILLIEPYVVAMEDSNAKGKPLKAMHIAEAVLTALSPSMRALASPQARFRQMHQALTDSHRAGNRHCLILEEAHNIHTATIKHLKRFYELEDGFSKLLSIIMIGQTELKDKLSERNSEVREVVQRCDMVELSPLDDIAGYVAHRCARVGADPDRLFARDAFAELATRLTVHGSSLCYPLVIVNILTAALNLAAKLGESTVTPDIIRAV